MVDMTTVGMGPYATQIFGDMGAEVIKIESPMGDVLRYTEPVRNAGMSACFLNLNRNKRFWVLDIKRDKDLMRLKELISEADVFVSNIRPVSLRRYGLDYEALRSGNPRLIYCGAYGYSESGPYAGLPAFDDIIQAKSGMAHFQGGGEHQDPQYVNTALVDKVVGLTMAYAIPMALYERERSGLGQAIEVPMFETMVSFLAVEHLAGKTFVSGAGASGYPRIMSRHRKPYATQDGHIALMPYTNAQWGRFFEIVGRPDLARAPEYMDAAARNANIDELYAFVADILSDKSTSEWVALLTEADIPHSEVLPFDALIEDPHIQATGTLFEYDHPTQGRLRAAGIPTRFSRTPGSIRSWARELPGQRASESSDDDQGWR